MVLAFLFTYSNVSFNFATSTVEVDLIWVVIDLQWVMRGCRSKGKNKACIGYRTTAEE